MCIRDRYKRKGLVYFVTSSQSFIHARNKHKQRVFAKSVHFFSSSHSKGILCKALSFSESVLLLLSLFTERPIRVLFLDIRRKMTQKMAQLCTENLFSLTIVARSELEEGKKWIDFAISLCLCLFRGRMKP